MKPLRIPDRFAAALLAVLLTAAGAPVEFCAGMIDCSLAAPAPACHDTAAESEGSCASPRVESDGDCNLAVQPPPAASERMPASPALSLPLVTAITWVAPSPASPATLAPTSPALQRSGRALLALHQTLLI